MKVWTIYEGYDYEGGDIKGVFATRELAVAAVLEKGYKQRSGYPDAFDGKCFEHGQKDYAIIEEHDVIEE